MAGIFVCTGPYKDAGLWLDGQYVIPSSFRVVAGEAKKSFTIEAKTAKGDLNVTFRMWGWNPALMEYWGTVDATFKGKKLPTGYCWLEHVPQIKMNSHPGGRKTATGQ